MALRGPKRHDYTTSAPVEAGSRMLTTEIGIEDDLLEMSLGGDVREAPAQPDSRR